MAAYTAIPDANLDPDSPARSVDALALRDNPIAITEAATGAPRLVINALANGDVSAGSTIAWLFYDGGSTTSTTYASANLLGDKDASVGVRVYAAGTITATFDHSGPSTARIVKNSVTVVNEWVTTTSASISENITVACGDLLTFQQKSSTGAAASWDNLALKANVRFMTNSELGA